MKTILAYDGRFNPVVIRAWRCATVTVGRLVGRSGRTFQSRRDPGMALRRCHETDKVRGLPSFNPVVIRAWRCARSSPCASVPKRRSFQSRRDPGMALRRQVPIPCPLR